MNQTLEKRGLLTLGPSMFSISDDPIVKRRLMLPELTAHNLRADQFMP